MHLAGGIYVLSQGTERRGKGEDPVSLSKDALSSEGGGRIPGGDELLPGGSPRSAGPLWQTLPAPEARAAASLRMLGLEFSIPIKCKSCASLPNYCWSFLLQGSWENGQEVGAGERRCPLAPLVSLVFLPSLQPALLWVVLSFWSAWYLALLSTSISAFSPLS